MEVENLSGSNKSSDLFHFQKIVIGILTIVSFFFIGILYKTYFLSQKTITKQPRKKIPKTASNFSKPKSSITNSKFIYAENQKGSDIQRLYAIDLDGDKRTQLSQYQLHKSNTYSSDPPVTISKRGFIAYVEQRNKLFIVDSQSNKRLLFEADSEHIILDLNIADDGNTIIFQEFDLPEIDNKGGMNNTCSNFTLHYIHTQTGEHKIIYSSTINYLRPLFISNIQQVVYVLQTPLNKLDCFFNLQFWDYTEILGKVGLFNKNFEVVSNLHLEENSNNMFHVSSIQIAPNGQNASVTYETSPANKLFVEPSKQYPNKLALIDLSTGKETTLIEDHAHYLILLDWYSDSKSLLYFEDERVKKINIDTKNIQSMLNIQSEVRKISNLSLAKDSILIYIKNEGEPNFQMRLRRVNLDGSNDIDIYKSNGFLHSIGVIDESPILKNSEPIHTPIELRVLKSFSSPDKKYQFIIKIPAQKTTDIDSEYFFEYIFIKNNSNSNEILVKNANSDLIDIGQREDIKEENWSPNNKHVFMTSQIPDSVKLYVFSIDGKQFSNGKRYLLANEVGFLTNKSHNVIHDIRWISNSQISITAGSGLLIPTYAVGIEYIFDVDKEIVQEVKSYKYE